MRLSESPRISPDIALLTWLYLAELCLGIVTISLHKKGERPFFAFATAPAGAGFLLATAMLVVAAGAIVSHARRRRDTSPFAAVTLMNVLTVSAMLVLGETAIRVFTVTTPAGPAFANTVLLPKDWTAVSARHRATLAQAAARGSYLVFDRDLGWSIGRNRHSEDPYRRYRPAEAQRAMGASDDIYLSSAEGLRSPVAGMSLATVPHTSRIALIGDSFTFGLEVHYDDSWGHQLERLLDSGTQVLNFGVDGYGLDQTILRYRRDVLSWHPSVVILSVINDDLRRTMCVYGFLCFPTFGEIPFPKPRFIPDGDSVGLLTKALPDPDSIFTARSIGDLPFIDYDGAYTPSQWERHYYDRSALLRYVFSRLQRWPEPRPETSTAAMEAINGALFREFVRDTRANGSIPIVLFLPSSLDFTPEGESSLGAARSVLAANHIAFHDLTECVRRVPAPERFVIAHYSPTASRAVAECVAPLIRALEQPSR